MIRKLKTQSAKRKTAAQNSKLFKFLVLSFSFTLYALRFTLNCYAQEITILYTGDTHAMIYPCSCPVEPDGGVARRQALIKQIRQANPHVLLLDSGGFFAGGLLDEYTQNTELDSQRSKINLKAMALMKYDALAIGDDEFNFGREFFQSNIDTASSALLSCNMKTEKVLPYIIKDIAGIKIGIIGVTTLAAAPKAGGLEFAEPKARVAEAVSYLRKTGVDIIVLLSHLGESEDLNLIKDIEGIDILIVGHYRAKDQPSAKIANTLVLRPSWQARRLDKLSLVIEDKKIKEYKVEELRLSDKIADDPDILAILPRCFSDSNCKKEGFVGLCQNPGSVDSSCAFKEANKISLTVITTRDCATCDTEGPVKFLKKQFPGLGVSYLYHPERNSGKLVKDFAISGLPVYLLGREIEKEKGFDSLKDNLEKKGDFYMLKPQFSGLGYFLNRAKIKGKLDLFLSLYDKHSKELLDVMKEFNPTIHFLAVESEGKFNASSGNPEVEEYLRAVCVQKYYPGNFWDYLNCRAKSIGSSWWEDCLGDLEVNKIRSCAKGAQGISLLRENTGLNKELQVMFGPTYLADNQEIFSSQGVPSKEELRKIIKR
ncbi:MAG: hypothetical protein NT066_03525 [Candidatus Omnitrophica bacterium]|nr:hypothetical protein [Candidatus Omnitrophota bacterium]